MTIRTASLTVAALAAIPAFAEKPALQMSGPGIRVNPIAVGTAQIIDGQIVRTSPMYDYTGGAGTRANWTCVYDCFEPDTYDPNIGVPVGFQVCPNTGGTPGSRWFFGAAYVNPFISADMSGVVGNSAEGVFHSWNWAPAAPEQCTILIFPTETYAACDTATPADGTTGTLGGIILDFGVLAAGAGYYFTSVDFTTTPILTLDLTGATGNVVIHSQTPGAGPPPFVLATASQPMLWGTTEDDSNTANDTRCGTNDALQYDDDAPTDAVHDLVVECYDYTFGICPNPLGMSLAWVGKAGAGCPNPGSTNNFCSADVNGDCIVDIGDLAALLGAFGSVTGDANYNANADYDNDGDVDIGDLAVLLGQFGDSCA